MTQLEESRRLLPESSPVKIMEMGSHVLVVDNFSGRSGIGMGKSIESSPFVVGGYTFTIQLYPNGANADANRRGFISLFIANKSPKAAQLVYDLQILERTNNMHYGYSSFGGRNRYHHVDNSSPGAIFGHDDFVEHSSIHKYYGPNDSISIRAAIGVVLDHDHDHDHDHHHHEQLPIAKSSIERHRCIIFQVGDKRFYESESVITIRCPTIISDYPQSNHIVLISDDVDPDVFKAVLWFLNNKHIHYEDQGAIANLNGLFALKMLAAADKFNLKDLRGQICHLLLNLCNLHVLYRYFEIDHSAKELWRKVSSWLPQKMKEA